jgi:hypothetical protein
MTLTNRRSYPWQALYVSAILPRLEGSDAMEKLVEKVMEQIREIVDETIDQEVGDDLGPCGCRASCIAPSPMSVCARVT